MACDNYQRPKGVLGGPCLNCGESQPEHAKPLPPEFSRQNVEQPNYQVKNEEIEALVRKLGHVLGAQMPEGWGFTLLIYDYGEKTGEAGKDALFYISSADRADMILTMKEFIKKQEH